MKTRSKLFGMSLMTFLLLVPTLGFAEGWQTTFQQEAVASHVASDKAYVVVDAGKNAKKAKRAASRLEETLRDGIAETLIGDESLGDLSGLNDEEIVEKASRLPVDRIVVVRVFPGSSGRADTVVAVVYQPDGTSDTALSGTYGEPLEPKERTANEGDGVTSQTADAIASVTSQEKEKNEEAREKYNDEFVWIHQAAVQNVETGAIRFHRNAFQGVHARPLRGRDYYDAVDRPDLAKTYARRRTSKTILNTTGMIAFAGGLTWALTGGVVSASCMDNCNSVFTKKPLLHGGILGGTGIVMSIAAGFINPHPLESEEALDLAEKHNEELKQELGLDEDYQPGVNKRAGLKARFNFGVDVNRDGAGARMSVSW